MIYDITQEIFSGSVYPGDLIPEYRRVRSFAAGDSSNATEFSMNAHNGTHLDAPIHRIPGGKAIDELDLEKCVGECEVIDIRNTDRLKDSDSKRILLKNCDHINAAVASLMVSKNVVLVGAEGLSIGSEEVHNILLNAEVVVLEGAVLSEVSEGKYRLSALPIKLGGCDGAPCRAILVGD